MALAAQKLSAYTRHARSRHTDHSVLRGLKFDTGIEQACLSKDDTAYPRDAAPIVDEIEQGSSAESFCIDIAGLYLWAGAESFDAECP